MSQSELAERTAIPEPLIAQIESGRYDPTWGDIRRIAQALDISLESLSERAEQHELDREV